MARVKPVIFALVAALFGLYLSTAGPSLVPYRDAGEMATALPTLGVLHPTSYPLYSVVGYLFSHLPLGNPAYRLNVLSALAQAVAWGFFALLLIPMEGLLAACCTILLGAVSYHFWWHSAVSEMYALNILFVVALLVAYERQRFFLWAFLLGLGLANRADLVLVAPAFITAYLLEHRLLTSSPAVVGRGSTAVDSPPKPAGNDALIGVLICFVLGLSLYAYLPLRALQAPLMNWNDPSTVERFFRSVLRKGYGGGLDMLSAAYKTGENFKPEIILYFKHLWRDYCYIGVPLALIGAAALLKARRSWFALALMGWLITGPLFIFLGNLPPNIHAVAILEAAYLMPDVFFLLFVAAGVATLGLFLPHILKGIFAGAFALYVGWFACHVYAQVNQRHNFLAVDYIRNITIDAPSPGLIVGRSDVPLFSLYYGHWIQPRAPGHVPVAQGLAGSAWYQEMMRRDESGLSVSAVRLSSDWKTLSQQNPGWLLFGAFDMDWPPEGGAHFLPLGLLNTYVDEPGNNRPVAEDLSHLLLSEFTVYRGVYRYGAYRDFFSNELVELYAKAWMSVDDLDGFFMAWSMKPDMPYAPLRIGYGYYTRHDYVKAALYYHAALRNFDALEILADEWKTFPAMRDAIRADHEQARESWKVLERYWPGSNVQ